MKAFEKKYGIDPEFAAEYVTLGSDSKSLEEAIVAINADQDLRESVKVRFNVSDHNVALNDIKKALSQ